MQRLLEQFLARARALPRGSVALIHYSGHGGAIGPNNFVFPTDVSNLSSDDLAISSIDLNELLEALPNNDEVSSVLIVDACRTYLRSRASISDVSSFRMPDRRRNAIVALSTSEDRPAADGFPGAGSPYVSALREVIAETPNAPLPMLFQLVRSRVVAFTQGGQVPDDRSNLLQPITLSGGTASPRETRTYGAQQALQQGRVSEAVEMFTRSAFEGDVVAMQALGALNLGLLGIPRNLPVALDWYRQAGERGTWRDRLQWATMVSVQSQDARTLDQARAVAQREVAAGRAEFNMALAALTPARNAPLRPGMMTPATLEIFQLVNRAAQARYPLALFMAGNYYQSGIGVQQNEAEAISNMRLAAQAGLPPAATRLGVLLNSLGRASRNPDRDREAIYWLQSASRYDAGAVYELGLLAYFGVGMRADAALALQFFRRAQAMVADPRHRSRVTTGEQPYQVLLDRISATVANLEAGQRLVEPIRDLANRGREY